jgi:hypothetical protein
MPLTETQIRRLPSPEKDTFLGDGRGLYLRRHPSGKKVWVFRTRVGGPWKTKRIGDWPDVTLAQARKEATRLAGRVLPSTITFADLLDEWLRRQVRPRYKSTDDIERYISRGKALAGH